MKRAFTFNSRTTCRTTGNVIDVLTVFFPRPPYDITVLTDELQDALKEQALIPDAFILVAPDQTAMRIADLWNAFPKQMEVVLARGTPPGMSTVKEHALFTFTDGGFQRIDSVSGLSKFDLDIQALIQDGLAQLVERNGAFQVAPAGHVFKHPSGKQSKQFFLASELLREDCDVYFVGMAICAAAWSVLNRATRLFIDTMGIYAVARAVHDLLLLCGRAPQLTFEVENFHSHGGFDEFRPSITDTDVALISASTSGGLPEQLHTEKQFRARNIITLLDVRRAGRVGWIVHANADFLDPLNPTAAIDPYETPIELVGEYFAARGKRPRTLTLALYHAPSSLKELLNRFSADGACSLNTKRSAATQIDLLSISAEAALESKEFQLWLKDEVRLRSPLSATHVVYLDDPVSKNIAAAVSAEILKVTGNSAELLPYSKLSSPSKKIGGVIVCAAVLGNGHILRLLSRDLREACPNASRHFLVGIGVPDTYESWQRLKQFLRQSGHSDRPYTVSHWKWLAVGRKRPNDCWSKYANLMQSLEHISFDAKAGWGEEIVNTSISRATDLLEHAQTAFLPSNGSQELRLTEGFVYWQPTADHLRHANHAAVSYLAITAVLQNAREYEEQSKRLRSTLFETVVLDPENFMRFNDGVLQAALLRAAYTAELDYSMNVESSQAMREILEKIFFNHQKKYGEAALEFAAALASGHLRLTRTDAAELFIAIQPIGIAASPLAGLLYAWWFNYLRQKK